MDFPPVTLWGNGDTVRWCSALTKVDPYNLLFGTTLFDGERLMRTERKEDEPVLALYEPYGHLSIQKVFDNGKVLLGDPNNKIRSTS